MAAPVYVSGQEYDAPPRRGVPYPASGVAVAVFARCLPRSTAATKASAGNNPVTTNHPGSELGERDTHEQPAAEQHAFAQQGPGQERGRCDGRPQLGDADEDVYGRE